MSCPIRSVFAQLKPLISLSEKFLLDEYRLVFAVNVTSPQDEQAEERQSIGRLLGGRIAPMVEAFLDGTATFGRHIGCRLHGQTRRPDANSPEAHGMSSEIGLCLDDGPSFVCPRASQYSSARPHDHCV